MIGLYQLFAPELRKLAEVKVDYGKLELEPPKPIKLPGGSITPGSGGKKAVDVSLGRIRLEPPKPVKLPGGSITPGAGTGKKIDVELGKVQLEPPMAKAAFVDELLKLSEKRKRGRKASHAANVGLGAIFGGALGAPTGSVAGSMMAAHMVGKRAQPPKGLSRWQRMRWYQTKAPGLAELTRKMSRGGRRGALIGGLSGLGLGSLLGHQIARALKKEGAAISSRLTPKSSNVRGFSYDPKTQDLVVTFKNGGTYRYSKVPPAIARALRRNKSVGKTIHRRVKTPGYEYEKIGERNLTKTANDPIKETVKIRGIPVALEWRRGETRKYFNHDPLKRKSTGTIDYNQKMKVDYGYVKGVIDADGEELDVYLGPDRESEKVFVLEKLRSTDASFDENKVMLGYGSKEEARKSYLQHQGKDELGKITEMTVPAFKAKFMRGNKFKKHANGDMLAYFRDHPQKLREKLERDKAKKGSAAQRFVLSRTPGGLKKKATLAEGIASVLIEKRRQIAKLAGAAKKTITWNGLTMKLEYLKGDTRSGVNGTTGEKWSRTMKDHYGYVPGTKGKAADGDAIDIYLNPEPIDGPVYRIRQKKRSGEFDEDKFLVAYGSELEARRAFKRNMPEWAFGSINGMTMRAFRNLVGQGARKAA